MTSNSVVLFKIEKRLYFLYRLKNFLNHVFSELWYYTIAISFIDEVKKIHDVMVEAGKAAGKLIIENAGIS